jgi:hypothetical protein
MARAMLTLIGPLPTALHEKLAATLEHVAVGFLPLSHSANDEVIHGALHPDDRADWLRNDDFKQALLFVADVRMVLEACQWAILQTLDSDEHSAMH